MREAPHHGLAVADIGVDGDSVDCAGVAHDTSIAQLGDLPLHARECPYSAASRLLVSCAPPTRRQPPRQLLPKYRPAWLSLTLATSSGVPSAVPDPIPPSPLLRRHRLQLVDFGELGGRSEIARLQRATDGLGLSDILEKRSKVSILFDRGCSKAQNRPRRAADARSRCGRPSCAKVYELKPVAAEGGGARGHRVGDRSGTAEDVARVRESHAGRYLKQLPGRLAARRRRAGNEQAGGGGVGGSSRACRRRIAELCYACVVSGPAQPQNAIDPDVCNGKPVVRGRTCTVESILNYLTRARRPRRSSASTGC